jgi:hypothetical protein
VVQVRYEDPKSFCDKPVGDTLYLVVEAPPLLQHDHARRVSVRRFGKVTVAALAVRPLEAHARTHGSPPRYQPASHVLGILRSNRRAVETVRTLKFVLRSITIRCMDPADIDVRFIHIDEDKAEYIAGKGVTPEDVLEVHGGAPRFFLRNANGIFTT